MKFEIYRKLENKVFTSTVKRDITEDAELALEDKYVNDLGPAEVEAGTKFEGYVTGTTLDDLVISDTESSGAKKIQFSLDKNKVAITKTFEVKYACDAKAEAPVVFSETVTIPALRVAELKCDLYEQIMQKRINAAIDVWKSQATTFEDTNPISTFNVDLQ